MFNPRATDDKIQKMKFLLPAVFFAIFLAVLLFEIKNNSSIGHGDTANTAVVARNLFEGRGFTVDYLWQFYKDYPSIAHPEDTWPLAQPTLVAVSYKMFGISTFAAKVPNVFLLILLMGSVYYIVYKLTGDQWFSLISCLLTFLSPVIIEHTLYPFNDIGLALAFVWLVFLTSQILSPIPKQSKHLLLWSIVSGLSILQKPSSIIFVGLALIFIVKEKGYKTLIKWAILPVILIPLPYFVRNQLLFGSPIFSLEGYHLFLTKYRDFQEIFKVYFNHLPSISTFREYGYLYVVQEIFRNFRFEIDSLITQSQLVHPLLLGASALYLLERKDQGLEKRLNDLTKTFFLVYLIFIPTVWHFELRYFLIFIPLIIIFLCLKANSLHLKGVVSFLLLALVSLTGIKSHLSALKVSPVSARETSSTWIEQNTSRQSIIMTQDPWELSFYSQRASVMIPLENLETTLNIAKKYKASYLQLDFPFCHKRPQVEFLCQGKNDKRFNKVYDDGEIIIYKMTL